jgi:hypothetical protein
MSAPKKGFVPPLFSKIGQATKDLFDKKYDFNYTVKTIDKTPKGVTVEFGSTASGASSDGFLKGKYVNNDFGEVESEVHTDPKKDSKVTLRLNKLPSGLKVNLIGSSAGKKGQGTAEIIYSQDYLATQGIVKSDLETTKLDASLKVGFDGFSVGGQIELDVSKGAEVSQTNVGLEWSQSPDLIISGWTDKNSDFANIAAFHKVNRDTSVAAKFRYEIAGKHSRVLTAGVEHALDFDTTVKAKAEIPTGSVSTAIEHRLQNPKLQFGAAAQFNVLQQPFTAEKFGLTLTFGDF